MLVESSPEPIGEGVIQLAKPLDVGLVKFGPQLIP
jgi:hypothetical protein